MCCTPEHAELAMKYRRRHFDFLDEKTLRLSIEATAPKRAPLPEHRVFPPSHQLADGRQRDLTKAGIERITARAEASRSGYLRRMVNDLRAKNGMSRAAFETPERPKPDWLRREVAEVRAYRGPYWKGDHPITEQPAPKTR